MNELQKILVIGAGLVGPSIMNRLTRALEPNEGRVITEEDLKRIAQAEHKRARKAERRMSQSK